MELTLTRTEKTKDYTMGRLEIDGEHFCDTLEPTWRDLGPGRPGHKIAGRTAIPDGRYPVAVTWSPKLKKWLPLLPHVPQVEGHPLPAGNPPDHPAAGRRGVDQRRLRAYASSAHTQKFSAPTWQKMKLNL